MITIGNRYSVPSGLGGSFDVRVLGFLPASTKMVYSDGTERVFPERVSVRIDMPKNPDFHDWTTEYGREFFEANATPL